MTSSSKRKCSVCHEIVSEGVMSTNGTVVCNSCDEKRTEGHSPSVKSGTSLAELTDIYEREGLVGIQKLISQKEKEVMERILGEIDSAENELFKRGKPTITTQGFTSPVCLSCSERFSWHNGAPPPVCKQCSEKHIIQAYNNGLSDLKARIQEKK